ncbi:MAG: hypothetical protein AABY13_03625, partial [Nanoarchaeota archaeon]
DPLKFWKKKEMSTPSWDAQDFKPKFDLPTPGMEGPPELGPGGLSPPPTLHEPAMPTFSAPPMGTPQSQGPSRTDLELIAAKLDTIKAQLETLNNRIAHLERIAEGTQKGW